MKKGYLAPVQYPINVFEMNVCLRRRPETLINGVLVCKTSNWQFAKRHIKMVCKFSR